MSNDDSNITDEYVSKVKDQFDSEINFGKLIIQPSLLDLKKFQPTHAVFCLANMDLPENKPMKIDDYLTIQKIQLPDYPPMKLEQRQIDIAYIKLPSNEGKHFLSQSDVERFYVKGISEDEFNLADALVRLRIFFACCNLSNDQLNSSAGVIIKHLPHHKLSLPNGYTDLKEIQNGNLKNEKTIANLSILKNLSEQCDNFGWSSITDGTYKDHSPMDNRYDQQIMMSSITLYTKLMKVIDLTDPSTKLKLILSLFYYQSAIEENHKSQNWNILMLQICLERIFTTTKYGLDSQMIFKLQNVSKFILEKHFPSEYVSTLNLQDLLSDMRNAIAHGKVIPEAYSGIGIDEKFIIMKKICKLVLQEILNKLSPEKTNLRIIIRELKEEADKTND